MANAPMYPPRPPQGRPPQARPYPPQYGAPARPRPVAPYGAQMGNQYGQGAPYGQGMPPYGRPPMQPPMAPQQPMAVSTGEKVKYTRKPMAFFVMLMSLLFIAVVVVSYFGKSIYEGLVLYKNLEFSQDISFVDPIFGIINVIKPGFMASAYYSLYLAEMPNLLAVKIAFYGLPAAIVLAVICALVLFIKSIIALSGKKDKVKLGFWSLFLLVLCIFIGVVAIIANGAPLAESIKPLMGTGAILNVGYAYYGAIGVSLLAFLFTIFSAGKRVE